MRARGHISDSRGAGYLARLRSQAAVTLVALAALACAGPQRSAPEGVTTGVPQDEEPKRGGVIVVAQIADPPGAFEPMRTATIHLGQVSTPMAGDGNLLKPCREDVEKVCPAVAEAWEANPDSTQYTFKIRDGILWHDGTPFTVQDAKFWLDLAFNGARAGDKTRPPAYFKGQMGEIKDVEALAGNRLRVTLAKPDPFWAATMTHLESANKASAIWHPRHLMEPRIQQGNVNLTPSDVGFVGIGPYKMEKYDKASVVQLRRWEKYWGKDAKGRQLPFLDGIDFVITPDPGAMDAAFRTGRLDVGARSVGLWLNGARYEALKKAMGDKAWFTNIEGAKHHLSLNSARPGPLQDARVRRAIQLWINREEYRDAIQGGPCCGEVHPGISPGSIWPDPNWKSWPGFNPATREKDRAEAKRLLAEAGYPEGFELSIFTRRAWADMSEWAVGELAPLGIRLTLDFVDDADRARRERAGDYFIKSFGGWTFEPGVGPEQYRTRMQRHSVNPLSEMKHEDPKVEEYFQRLGRVAGSLDERVKVWREFERYLVLEQALGIPTFTRGIVIPYRSYVKGVFVPKSGHGNNVDWSTEWLDK